MNEALNTNELSSTTDFMATIDKLTGQQKHNESIVSEQVYSRRRKPSLAEGMMRFLGISSSRAHADVEQIHLQFDTPHVFTDESYGLPEGQREVIIERDSSQQAPQRILLRVFEAGEELGQPVELTESPELLHQATVELDQLADFYETVRS